MCALSVRFFERHNTLESQRFCCRILDGNIWPRASQFNISLNSAHSPFYDLFVVYKYHIGFLSQLAWRVRPRAVRLECHHLLAFVFLLSLVLSQCTLQLVFLLALSSTISNIAYRNACVRQI